MLIGKDESFPDRKSVWACMKPSGPVGDVCTKLLTLVFKLFKLARSDAYVGFIGFNDAILVLMQIMACPPDTVHKPNLVLSGFWKARLPSTKS